MGARRILTLVLLASVFFAWAIGTGYAGETVAETIRLVGLPPITVTSNSDDAAATAVDDAGSPSKRAFIRTLDVDGDTVLVLVRVEAANGKLWVDLVSTASIGSMTERVAAMDLSATAIGHPSPTQDRVDESAISEAGG